VELSEDDMRVLDEASSKYLYLWGRGYGELRAMRFIPAVVQRLAIAVMGGI
jgi:hypothetical protein